MRRSALVIAALLTAFVTALPASAAPPRTVTVTESQNGKTVTVHLRRCAVLRQRSGHRPLGHQHFGRSSTLSAGYRPSLSRRVRACAQRRTALLEYTQLESPVHARGWRAHPVGAIPIRLGVTPSRRAPITCQPLFWGSGVKTADTTLISHSR